MTRSADHWLWRLEASAWLVSAAREIELGRRHLDSRRKAVTHARRAAGMGLNGVLVACAMALASGTHNPFIYFRF